MVGQKIPLDEVLARIGIGYFQLRLWWICGFGFSAAAIEVVLMSFVFPELRNGPWQLTEYQLGSLATVIGCGSIFGTLLFGKLADSHGRRPVFMATVLVVVVFGVLSSFSPSVYWLAGLRFGVGFGYGGNIAVDFTLFSEFLPTKGRGMMLFLLTGFWPIGQIFAALLAWYVVPEFGWQPFVALCTIPSLLTAFARPLIPESPRWLLVHGRAEEATQICRDIAELNGKSFNEVGLTAEVEVCLENESTSLASIDQNEERIITTEQTPYAMIQRFFSPALWQTTVGLLIIVSALNYTGYGVLTLMPSFLEMKGVSHPEMYKSMVLNSLAELPGVALATFCATNLGRLNPLRASLFLTGLALFGFACVRAEIHIMICTMLASCFLESGWALYHVYVPEVYPTDCRAFATGFLSAAGSVVAMGGPLVSAALISTQNIMSVILVFCSVSMLACLSAIMLLHIETKDRDLCDITSSLSSENLLAHERKKSKDKSSA